MTATSLSESRETRHWRRLAYGSGLAAATIGVAVLAGWTLNSLALNSLFPILISMKANTAIGMLLCGSALAILSQGMPPEWIRRLAKPAALIALMLGALTLGEYLFGWDLRIDQWLFTDLPGTIGTSQPGRMSPTSGLCFVFIGAALLTAVQNRFERHRQPVVAGMAACVTVIGALALAGYILEERFGYHLWNYTGTAFHTAAGFVVLGVGLLALVHSQKRLQWSLGLKNTAAFVMAVALIVVAAGSTYNFSTRLQETSNWVSHTQEVLRELQNIATDVATIESNQRGYIVTGDEAMFERVAAAKIRVPIDSSTLKSLTADNFNQQQRLDRLGPLIAQRIEFADQTIAARRQQGFAAAQQMIATGTGTRLTDRIGLALKEMQDEEESLLDSRRKEAKETSVTTFLLLPLGLLLTLAAMSLGLLLLNTGAGEQFQAQRAVLESQARMAGIINSAMDAIVSIDQKQQIILFNGAAERMFLRSAEEAIGQRLDMLIPQRFRGAHPGDVERFGKSDSTSRSVSSLGTLSGLRSDGKEFPIEGSISQVNVGGEKIFTVVIRDISDRQTSEKALRESEEQLRFAIEATQLGTWELNPETGVRRWSERSKMLFGFPADAEIHTDMIEARVHPDDRHRLDAAMRHALQSGNGNELDIEFRISGIEEGEERWIQSRGRVFFEDGRAVRLIGTMLDITERKRAEAKLRASEDRYRTLFECAPDGIVIADPESFYLGANASVCRMLQYSLDELIGMHASDIVTASEVENIVPALDTINAGSNYHREWQFRRKDGSVFAAEVIATMMPDGNLLGMIRDITERKQAEEALRGSEERFRTMANSIPQLAWMARADGYIYWYNQRWYEYTGTTMSQMEGGGWQSIHDPVMLPAVMKGWTAAIEGGKSFEMEFPLRGADGQYRAFLTRVQPLMDAEGRVVQWFGTNTDVEALKQAEERIQHLNAGLERRVTERTAQLEAAVTELSNSRAELKSLFESLPGLYLVLTPDLKIVAVSDAYLKATMTTREGIMGRGLFEIFPDNPADPGTTAVANMQASIARVIQTSASDTMAIQRNDVRRPDGFFEERYWSPINSPMLRADREIKYIVHRVEDVTEFVRQKAPHSVNSGESSARMQQMEAEIFQSSQKLQASNHQLEAANKELEAFSYSVSHDLRAPLRGVDGFVRMLQEDFSHQIGAEGNRLLDVVSSEAKRMGRLIDDLLTFSRLGREHMGYTTVDMCGLAGTVFKNLTTAAPELAPRFELQALPPARGDLGMLRQVFVNLIGNAIKFSRHQTAPDIEIGFIENPAPSSQTNAEKPTAGNSIVTYYVKDNGAGFDEQYSHKLFGVFQRLHSEEEFEGTGVGLALVQRVIHRHKGKVWGKGATGEGATFYFTLPA